MALWRSPEPRVRVSRVKGALGLGVLGGALYAKLWLLRRLGVFGHGGSGGSDSYMINRRGFSRLPRRKQREYIYGQRAKIRDLENITYGSGYAPYGSRRRRRLSLF